jgi:hypothetical protein
MINTALIYFSILTSCRKDFGTVIFTTTINQQVKKITVHKGIKVSKEGELEKFEVSEPLMKAMRDLVHGKGTDD